MGRPWFRSDHRVVSQFQCQPARTPGHRENPNVLTRCALCVPCDGQTETVLTSGQTQSTGTGTLYFDGMRVCVCRRGTRRTISSAENQVAWAVVRAMCVVAAIFTFGCGGGSPLSSTPTPMAPSPSPAPSPPPGPTSPPPAAPANVAGNWTGTLESSGFAPRSITILAFQGGTCVDGAWRTEPPEWSGAISGFADVSSFSGSVSFERPADGPGKCAGIATFSGEVGTETIRWTSAGFTGSCAGGLPQSVTITLRRQ
jgi:hypothetical protein